MGLLVLWFFYCEVEIFPVVSGDYHRRVIEPQNTENIFLDLLRGRSRISGDHRAFRQHSDKFHDL